ncbi:hypothetical protein PAPYR_5882 [Paratrimastix pyriformis]|uniref:Uncharacterized protein n=1 Tax=Paratrimastix pyriformis TaxID=342808 RepID=A0ABQ8UGH0_9EUKA|nr:hypothetical protein PAPYR_5882 [Paratrimastix pyriformis]
MELLIAADLGDLGAVQKHLDEGVSRTYRFKHHFDLTRAINQDATPLHLAVRSGHESVVRFLLSAGSDANEKDFECWNALHYASNAGHPTLIPLLLQAGCNPHCADSFLHQIPADFAAHRRLTELVELLRPSLPPGHELPPPPEDVPPKKPACRLRGHLPLFLHRYYLSSAAAVRQVEAFRAARAALPEDLVISGFDLLPAILARTLPPESASEDEQRSGAERLGLPVILHLTHDYAKWRANVARCEHRFYRAGALDSAMFLVVVPDPARGRAE